MEIPPKIEIVDGFYFTDGGSIVLIAEEPDRTRLQITLSQHRFLEIFDPNVIPGRLYFDHHLIPVRSEAEAELISALAASKIVPAKQADKEESPAEDGPVVVVGDDLQTYYAKVGEGPQAVLQHLIENLIEFVESKEYVRLAKKMSKKLNED